MKVLYKKKTLLIILIFTAILHFTDKSIFAQNEDLKINKKGYLEIPGLNVMVFSDYYPEGHQGGVSIIQNGERIATNGDIRLKRAPGQWQPLPKKVDREVDSANQRISASMAYPDSSRHRKGFNPMIYPDLQLDYTVNVEPLEGSAFRVTVDLEEPLPERWVGKVGFNMELFPGLLFGKSYYMDDNYGHFPRYANSSMEKRKSSGELETKSMAEGTRITIAPGDKERRMKIKSIDSKIKLIDGRSKHNNGWFVLRSLIPKGASENAIEWIITPNVEEDWKYGPVIHVSQVGYHTNQEKIAVIERDKREDTRKKAVLKRLTPDGEKEAVLTRKPEKWGKFLRYNYLHFDFSEIETPGMYEITYGDEKTRPFKISPEVFTDDTWQPTLEYFLPVQMCHIRVNEKYRVWHGACHLDDALRAPHNINHFDGYHQNDSPADDFNELEHVPELNKGGWHDAGDYDLRVESQAGTVLKLALMHESFDINYDQTYISQDKRLAEIHHPDGKPDILQQVKHGALAVLNGYKQLGTNYRGIIVPSLRQYVHLGDASTMTDNTVAEPKAEAKEFTGLWYTKVANKYSKMFDPLTQKEEIEFYQKELDDRLVFTEENPSRTYYSIGSLAAASRVLKGFDDSLSRECLQTAENLWEALETDNDKSTPANKIQALAELILTTGKEEYKEKLKSILPAIREHISSTGWTLGRVLPKIDDQEFVNKVHTAIKKLQDDIEKAEKQNPFGVPYKPDIWGAGWGIQEFGFEQYFLHTGFPEYFDKDLMLNALNFVLGCHPGSNTVSFASNVGSNSLEVAYGINRADWSFIPGGVGSGTALIRPDFPELKTWPYFWQQSEYVMGGGATDFMFLALAANQLLNEEQE